VVGAAGGSATLSCVISGSVTAIVWQKFDLSGGNSFEDVSDSGSGK